MVRHHHEFVATNVGKMFRDGPPALGGHLSDSIQAHLPVADGPEQAGALMGTNGDEIGASLGVIVTPEPDGAAAMAFGIVCYSPRSFRKRSAFFTRSSPEMSFGRSVSRRAVRVSDSRSAASVAAIKHETCASNSTRRFSGGKAIE